LDGPAKADLIAPIIDEAERLNRFIVNLLDMTKLESGSIVPNAALHDLGKAVDRALERTNKILAYHRIEVDLAKDLPMVEIDAVLFEQVLFNLLDNAAKYAPAGTTVRIQSWRDRDSVGLQMLDERRRHSAGRFGGNLRQVLSAPQSRPSSGGHRVRSRDLTWLH
jgi:two-component system sensor histidine kinase KdpD